MKFKKKTRILIVLGLFFVGLSIFNNNNRINNSAVVAEVDLREDDNANLTNPKGSAFWTVDYIHIDGNWSDTLKEDWCNGDGSWGNPYVIENVIIDASSSPTENGIFINNSKNDYFIINNCTVTKAGIGTWESGIKLENTNNGSLTNNNCSNNVRMGILLYNDSDNNTISGNTANNNYNGIFLQNSENNIISGNTANNNDWSGISLLGDSDNNTISGNTANNNYNGIFLQDSDNNIISGNTVNNNDLYGILLLEVSDDNTISGNTASNAGTTYQNVGIYLDDDCDNNTISGNLIKDNVNNGIFIKESSCENNNIYYNSFTGTTGSHASDNGTNNNWNSTLIGNYWDNHTSPDLNKDGIVDDPYNWITGAADSVDNHPLAQSPVFIGERIHIDDTSVSAPNWSQTAKLNLWSSGNGTFNDPYLLEGLEIDGGGVGSCILIGNSSVYFTIQSCKVYNSGGGIYDAGIKLENTNNGTITKNNCSNNGRGGILFYNYCYNNTISGNTANNNDFCGIRLIFECDNNTISGNNVDNPIIDNQNYGISLYSYCDDNTISGNTANDNYNAGIYLYSYCDDNTISGNAVNDNSFDGIYLINYCDYNTISGNTVNDNGFNGIVLFNDCDDNIILGNTIDDNSNHGIDLNLYCDNNNITDNYIYFNTIGAIRIYSADCFNTLIKANILVSIDEKFIIDIGTNILLASNYYLNTPPCLFIEVIFQSFSTTEFIETINISSQCLGLDISSLSIQIWWNGTNIPSNNITELGNGLYNISLTSILVEPGENPILLNMTITEAHHTDKYFKLELAVDPEAVDKSPAAGTSLSSGSSSDDDDDTEEVIIPGYNIYILIGIICIVPIVLIKKRWK